MSSDSKPHFFLRVLAPLCSIGATAFAFLVIFVLDGWLGLLAYPLYYAAFAVGIAGIVSLPSFLRSTRAGAVLGGLALCTLLMPFLLPAPSARLLRSAMVAVPVGATENEVRAAVAEAYAESDYALPQIHAESERIHVSLLSQEAGDCTALIFLIEDGRVVRKAFSAD